MLCRAVGGRSSPRYCQVFVLGLIPSGSHSPVDCREEKYLSPAHVKFPAGSLHKGQINKRKAYSFY